MIDVMRIAEKYDTAIDQFNKGKPFQKNDWRLMLILLRFLIRYTMGTRNNIQTELRYYRRQHKKLQGQNVTFLFLDIEIKKYEVWMEIARKNLIGWGKALTQLLDGWQEAGATREELFNLCNAHRAKASKKEALERPEESFSALVGVYNLDYSDDKSDWIEETTDAPFTHALKEYMLDQMINTRAGRMAAHEAMCTVFPNIMDNLYYSQVGEDGKEYLYDNNGEFLGMIGN